MDITTQAEQNYLAGLLDAEDSGDVWIGLTGSGTNAPLYWMDGSALDFEAWDFHGRDNGETCVRMTQWSGYNWGDKNCSTKYGFVCELECKSSFDKNVETKWLE